MRKFIVGTVVILAGASAPVIPTDTELLYSYETDVAHVGTHLVEIPASATSSAKTETVSDPGTDFPPEPDGRICIAVFKGDGLIYNQIPCENYRKMKERDGHAFNPKGVEMQSALNYFTPKAEAAIAFDASTCVSGCTGFPATATSYSYSHTIAAGSDRILFVGTWDNSSTNHVTTVTYNGSGMTDCGITSDARPTDGIEIIKCWYLVAPSTGANNVTVNISPTNRVHSVALSYTGASQTSIPDATSKSTGSTDTFSQSVTTVADNSWVIWFQSDDGSAPSCTSGCTERRKDVSGAIFSGDSNGPKTPACSFTFQLTGSTNGNTGIMISFAPAVAGGAAPVSTAPSIIIIDDQ